MVRLDFLTKFSAQFSHSNKILTRHARGTNPNKMEHNKFDDEYYVMNVDGANNHPVLAWGDTDDELFLEAEPIEEGALESFGMGQRCDVQIAWQQNYPNGEYNNCEVQ